MLFSPPPDPRPRSQANRVEHPDELTAETLWSDVSARLRGTLNEKTFRNWFGEVSAVSLDDERFVLAVPTDLTREQIERRFAHLMSAGVTDALGSERRLELVVRPRGRVPVGRAARHAAGRTGLAINPKYTFDSFVIGSSNRFAHAAALAIAEAPAQAYNPLFIYGHTGLGKTHLLHAIANYIGLHSSSLGVRYVTSETFMNDFINSLARQAHRGLQAALPRLRRAPDRRRAVLRAQGADPGGVLPHLQLAPRGGPADRDELRPAAARHRDARGPAAVAVRVGADHRHPAAGPRDADRDPSAEGEVRRHRRVRSRGAHAHREPRDDEHPRARGRAHARRRVRVADRAPDGRRARPGRPARRLPAGRAGGRLDRADPGARLRPLRRHA